MAKTRLGRALIRVEAAIALFIIAGTVWAKDDFHLYDRAELVANAQGCYRKNDAERLWTFKREGDEEAYKSFWGQKLSNAECKLLATETVYIDKIDPSSELVCVREKGSLDECLWTSNSVLGKE